jgi:amino-acid racemase
MKVIGLIGDMSCNSSLAYYRPINELVDEKLGGFHSARIILHSLAFDETGPNDMLRVLSGMEQK